MKNQYMGIIMTQCPDGARDSQTPCSLLAHTTQSQCHDRIWPCGSPYEVKPNCSGQLWRSLIFDYNIITMSAGQANIY